MQQRPVNLNLFKFSFPITAIVSIFHRASGIVLLLAIPVFLTILQNALYYQWVSSVSSRVIIWCTLTALIFHLFAGIRHLCMDSGFGEDKRTAALTSYLTLGVALIFSLIVGVRLC